MTKTELINLVSAAYSDGLVAEYWDPIKEEPVDSEAGDTLAYFIVLELNDTFDPDLDDICQLDEADRVLQTAIDQLMDIQDALSKKRIELENVANG